MHSLTSDKQSGVPVQRAATAAAAVTAVRQALVVLGFGAVSVLLASALLTPDGLPPVELCLFYRVTGLPCPSCGLTRAFCAISHGDWAAAWRFNPFAFPLYAGVVATPLWAVWKWYHPQRALLTSGACRIAARVTLLLLVGMVLHGIWRILRGNG
jgi:hypothetical protein